MSHHGINSVLKSLWYLQQTFFFSPAGLRCLQCQEKEKVSAQGTKWQTFESPSLLFKSFFSPSFHFLHSYQSVVSEHHFNPLQKCLWRNLFPQQLQKNRAFLPWIPPAREIKALSLFVLHSHTHAHTDTQYAMAHPPLQRQGSMNLFLLTKHIQARAEQRSDA